MILWQVSLGKEKNSLNVHFAKRAKLRLFTRKAICKLAPLGFREDKQREAIKGQKPMRSLKIAQAAELRKRIHRITTMGNTRRSLVTKSD